jgi:hypothetical protein
MKNKNSNPGLLLDPQLIRAVDSILLFQKKPADPMGSRTATTTRIPGIFDPCKSAKVGAGCPAGNPA